MRLYDLLLKGGHVIDPAAGIDGVCDVAIRRGRVAEIREGISEADAGQVIDVHDHYVTPGFIDLHSHVFAVMSNCVQPDRLAAATGVTTWVDAGSTGARAVTGFRRYIADPSTVRIVAFMNISAIGGVGAPYTYERLEWCDPTLLETMANAHNDFVVGVKVQLGVPFTARHGLDVMRRAREAADRCGLPLMVHISWSPPNLEEAIALMKPGDILTHAFTGASMRVLDSRDRLFGFVRDAFEAGVICDVGHGSGSFSFPVAEVMLSNGYPPDTISTDIHEVSIDGPMFDLPTCMSKFLQLGMDLSAVVNAVTARPAQILGMQDEIGTLRKGSRADVVCFRVERGNFTFYDSQRNARIGNRLITPALTFFGGRRLHPEAPAPLSPTRRLTEPQRAYYERIRRTVAEPPIYRLQGPDDFGPPVPVERDERPLPHEPWGRG